MEEIPRHWWRLRLPGLCRPFAEGAGERGGGAARSVSNDRDEAIADYPGIAVGAGQDRGARLSVLATVPYWLPASLCRRLHSCPAGLLTTTASYRDPDHDK